MAAQRLWRWPQVRAGEISPRSGESGSPPGAETAIFGGLVAVVGAWAYPTWYGPALTVPSPLAAYSTPSRPGGRAHRPLTISTP